MGRWAGGLVTAVLRCHDIIVVQGYHENNTVVYWHEHPASSHDDRLSRLVVRILVVMRGGDTKRSSVMPGYTRR